MGVGQPVTNYQRWESVEEQKAQKIHLQPARNKQNASVN